MANRNNFLTRLFNRKKTINKKQIRLFKAGEQSRLTMDWIPASSNYDKDIRESIELIRSRARDLAQNNDYVKRYINLCVMNIVGHNGFKFQSKVFDNGFLPDELANEIIETSFDKWGRKENCTITGQLTFTDVQKLLITQISRDGEAFIYLIKDPTFFCGMKLQILEPDDIPHDLNQDLANGNIIRLGIEFDKFRRPINYYVRKKNTENISYTTSSYSLDSYDQIPASNIIHCYLMDRPRQSRGISWLHQSMLRLKHISAYEEAALVNARVGASKVGFFTSENGVDDYTGDSQDTSGNIIMNAEPGSFEQLPPGIKFQSYEPDFPQTQYADYIKACLRGVSSGLGVSYNLLANDLEGVNYSSIRAGLLDERENWKHLQTWFIDNFLKTLFSNFLEMGILNGDINLPMRKFDKFNSPEYIGRRWAWVDPRSDIEAKILELKAGFTTNTQIVSEMGKDLEDIYKEIDREKKMQEKFGISLNQEEGKVNGK